MAIYRADKSSNFTVVNNTYIRDINLSLKAKGLMTILLSLPTKWDFSIRGLETLSEDGKAGVRTAVLELESAGYLRRRKEIDLLTHQFVGYQYDVFEIPIPPEKPDESTEENYVESKVENSAEYAQLLVKPIGKPIEKPDAPKRPFSDFPMTGFPTTGFPTTENRTQYNT